MLEPVKLVDTSATDAVSLFAENARCWLNDDYPYLPLWHFFQFKVSYTTVNERSL